MFRIDARGPAFLLPAPGARNRGDVCGHFCTFRRLPAYDGACVRLRIILLTAAMAPVALAIGASGQTRPMLPGGFAPAAVTQPPERSVVGTLDGVDPKMMEIVVSSPAGKQTLHLQPSVTIRQGSKTVKTSELFAHKGERVKVRYRVSGGVQQAEWIVLASPSPRRPKRADKT